MARAAEFVLRELRRFDDGRVNLASSRALVGHYAICVRLRKNPLQFGISGRPVDWLEKIALNQRKTAAVLPVGVLQAMTNHASNAFARSRMAVGVGNENRLVEIHSYLVMAANAEIPHRASIGKNNDALHGIEHR